jgi:hypothetical protein
VPTSTQLRPSIRDIVFQFVDGERAYQDEKFGGRPHEIPSWLMLAKREIAEAEEKWCRADKDEEGARAEVLQALAVLVACLEQHGPAHEPKHREVISRLENE